MSTTFAIFKIPVQTDENGEIVSEYTESDHVEVAFHGNGGQIFFTGPFELVEFALKDTVPVYPIDNGAGGIYTVGDIKKAIKRQLKGQKKKEPKPKRVLHPGFLVWCSYWPKDDSFDEFEENRHFTFVNKNTCERKYLETLKEYEGKYTEEDFWEALKYEIEWRKEKSRKNGKNELRYMNGPDPYLNQRKFEPFLGKRWNSKQMKTELKNPDEMFL